MSQAQLLLGLPHFVAGPALTLGRRVTISAFREELKERKIEVDPSASELFGRISIIPQNPHEKEKMISSVIISPAEVNLLDGGSLQEIHKRMFQRKYTLMPDETALICVLDAPRGAIGPGGIIVATRHLDCSRNSHFLLMIIEDGVHRKIVGIRGNLNRHLASNVRLMYMSR